MKIGFYDLREYEDKIADYHRQLVEFPDAGKKTIKELYLFVLKNFEEGIIGPKKFAYDITGTMFNDITSHGKLKKIVELAADLEIPDDCVEGDPKKKMKFLIKMIKDL